MDSRAAREPRGESAADGETAEKEQRADAEDLAAELAFLREKFGERINGDFVGG